MTRQVLFVDDEENILSAYTRNLRKLFAIETANGGDQALVILAERGPFAVIVADMRMPNMDGIQLLARVKELYPDTVRVMLTGNADQATAMEAVNRGAIFRFLTKPCELERLLETIDAALEQHRLITAEKELLEHTLTGAVRMLGDLLSHLDPTSFGRSQALADLSERVASRMGMEATWRMGIASVLAQVGMLAVPHPIMQKIHGGAILNSAEREIFNQIPGIGAELIQNIPRLEKVAEIVYYAHKNFNGTGFPNDEVMGEAIPLGARILRVVDDFLNLVDQKSSPRVAVSDMFSRTAWYDLEVLQALKQVLEEDQEVHAEPQSLRLDQLEVGMRLLQDAETQTGWLVLPAGTTLRPGHLEKLRNFARLTGIVEPILVKVQSTA